MPQFWFEHRNYLLRVDRLFSCRRSLEDFVVHEAAHVFHNCEREALGLPHSRHRESLLEIEYGKHKTFAYACEAYSRLLKLGCDTRHRQDLLAELAAAPLPSDGVWLVPSIWTFLAKR